MTSSKFLVIPFAMALVAWSPGRAATDSAAADTGTSSTTPTGTTTHHRHHHSTTGSGTTSTDNAAATTSGEGTTSKIAKSGKTKTTSGQTASITGKTEAGTDKTSAGSIGDKASETSSNSITARKLRKKHAARTETAMGEKTLTGEKTPQEGETKSEAGTRTSRISTTKSTPAEEDSNSSAKISATPNAPSAGGAAAAAATVVNGKTAVATPGKGHHRRHGRTETPPLPEPPIIISTVNVPPLSPAAAPPLGLPAVSNGVVPTVVTSLPVPRPGSDTTAAFALVRNPGPPVNTHFTFSDMPARTHVYPWKRRIVTTVFWIGEGGTPMSAMTNKSSAWDINWVHDNGGADDQYDMSGYGSGSHASLLNPFYVALPFNDLAYPDKTSRWLPPGWYKPAHHGEKQISSCQGRWIEIKNAAGRSCFAQWEDVGPVVTDDAEYVFGSASPAASRGLDVSPAVSRYLGFDSTAYTSWRFVDDDDVPPGLWLRYNEQAILFQALKDQARRGTPIQALSQPVPDGADDSHSEKEIRAGRG